MILNVPHFNSLELLKGENVETFLRVLSALTLDLPLQMPNYFSALKVISQNIILHFCLF